jgi:hypothetical protein
MTDAKSGHYNILLKDEYDSFDHQIPIDEFISQLEDGTTFDEVCILGLGEFLQSNDEGATKLSRVLQDRTIDLRRANSTVQFAVEGSFQRVKGRGGYELKYKDELYRLDSIFGAQLSKHEEGWLVAPFNIS